MSKKIRAICAINYMQTSMYTPQSYQKALIFVNHVKIRQPFSNPPCGKWHPPNLQRMQQNLLKFAYYW